MFGKSKVAALVAEFLGTGVLTITILSVQHSGIGYPFFVAAAAGLAMVLIGFAVGETSGGYFNPAITLGQWTAGKVATVSAILFIAVEFLGAWGAYHLYAYLVNNHLTTVGGHFTARILVAESVGTGIFAFAFAAAVYKNYSRAVTATFAGLGLMLGSLAASSGAIGLLNPAVALGVRAWVWGTYVLGPVIGAIIGTQLYRLVFADSEESGFLASLSSVASFKPSTGTVVKPSSKSSRKASSKKKR